MRAHKHFLWDKRHHTIVIRKSSTATPYTVHTDAGLWCDLEVYRDKDLFYVYSENKGLESASVEVFQYTLDGFKFREGLYKDRFGWINCRSTPYKIRKLLELSEY